MLNIYSKVDPEKIILSLIRKNEITNSRQNITPDEEFLQAGVKITKAEDFFKAHKHLPCNKVATTTQEAWVILDGKVEGTFYDLDDSLLCSLEISDGDCVVIYRGGHSLKILDDDTILYEFKNGPYYGVKKDKTYIGE
jgi:hypothetical protein|tara:strand:- start:5851 stop:6264 length:414 start_codon:yes stop_codon:yes gene_type:complete